MSGASRVRALIEEHGGIAVLLTHPVYPAKGPVFVEYWQNTIVCRDGWSLPLTTQEEDELRRTGLPDRLRAAHHLRVDGDKVTSLTT